jgi:hypothetical protein
MYGKSIVRCSSVQVDKRFLNRSFCVPERWIKSNRILVCDAAIQASNLLN